MNIEIPPDVLRSATKLARILEEQSVVCEYSYGGLYATSKDGAKAIGSKQIALVDGRGNVTPIQGKT